MWQKKNESLSQDVHHNLLHLLHPLHRLHLYRLLQLAPPGSPDDASELRPLHNFQVLNFHVWNCSKRLVLTVSDRNFCSVYTESGGIAAFCAHLPLDIRPGGRLFSNWTPRRSTKTQAQPLRAQGSVYEKIHSSYCVPRARLTLERTQRILWLAVFSTQLNSMFQAALCMIPSFRPRAMMTWRFISLQFLCQRI